MVLYYTNKEIFVLSAVGCMDTEPDGLESILAGNEEGAKGCCLSVDMTADGIAVLSSDGYCVANDGTRLSITDYSYAELHQAAPQLVPAGQAIELARTCRAKIAITVHNPVSYTHLGGLVLRGVGSVRNLAAIGAQQVTDITVVLHRCFAHVAKCLYKLVHIAAFFLLRFAYIIPFFWGKNKRLIV